LCKKCHIAKVKEYRKKKDKWLMPDKKTSELPKDIESVIEARQKDLLSRIFNEVYTDDLCEFIRALPDEPGRRAFINIINAGIEAEYWRRLLKRNAKKRTNQSSSSKST